jgi:predicted phage tail protein
MSRRPDGTFLEEPRPGLRVVVKKGGGKGDSASAPQTTDTAADLRSIAYISVLDLLCEGNIKGLHTGDWRSLFLDGTPFQNADSSYNFRAPITYIVHGTPNQEVIPGFPNQQNTVSVGIQMFYSQALIRRVNPGTTSCNVLVQVDALFYTTPQGQLNDTGVTYNVYYRYGDGGWILGQAVTIQGKTTSPYQRGSLIFFSPTTESIDIQVFRTTPDNTDENRQDVLRWVSYTENIDQTLNYADTAMVGFQADSHYWPSIPQRAYWLDGRIVQIPSNYDPVNRTYSGDWDGTFVWDFTNNPAWVLYDIMTDTRAGCGRDIDAGSIDKWGLYEAAQYNDEWVPDQEGGFEPRFTCNCVINTRQDAYTVLAAVASSMRALLYYSNGMIMIAQDRPQPAPTRYFSPANVENGLFDYAGTDVRSMFNAAAITWNNPDEMYQPNVDLVVDPSLLATQEYRDTSQTAFGTTSRGQAIRLGRWLVFTSQYETELVTIKTSIENADVRPGEIVAITDPSRAGARLGGRTLFDEGADTVTLDEQQSQTINLGWTLWLTVGSADDAPLTIFSATITAILGNGQYRLNAKPMAVPAGSLWVAQASTVNPTLWRVLSVQDQSNAAFQILASQYEPTKYTYVDYGPLLPEAPTSLLPSGPIKPPSAVAVKEYIYLDNAGAIQFGMTVSWTASPDPRTANYILQANGPGGDLRTYRHIIGVSYDVAPAHYGTWQLSVTAIDNLGRYSAAATITYLTIGLTKPPAAPSSLYLLPQGNVLHLTWPATGEINLLFWWLKWSPVTDGSASWATATTIAARVDKSTLQFDTPLRAGTYLIKAVNALGIESTIPAVAICLIQQSFANVIFDEAEQPSWAGTRGKWRPNLSELWLPPPSAREATDSDYPGQRAPTPSSDGFPNRVAAYDFINALDIGLAGEVTMDAVVQAYGDLMSGDTMSSWVPLSSATPLASGTGPSYRMSSWVPLAVAKPLAMGSSSAWDAHVEARVSQDGSAWGSWFPCKSTTITGQAFQWRLIGSIYDLATTLRATRAEVVVSVRTRTQEGNDVALDATTGALTVSFSPPFAVTPNVQFTARQGLAPGGNIVLVTATRDSFTAQHLDASGADVGGGSIDYVATGYGSHA